MIASGKKKEEYREIKPYWEKRLYHPLYPKILQFREYDAVEFRNGYKKDAPKILLACNEITVGVGNAEWGAPNAPVFIIKLGYKIDFSPIQHISCDCQISPRIEKLIAQMVHEAYETK